MDLPTRLLALASLTAMACAPMAPKTPTTTPVTWLTSLNRESPLVGRIWDVARQEFVSEEAFVQAVGAAHFVLLGEKHDNPDHHQLQARVLGALVQRGRRPTLAFEMIDPDKQPAIDQFVAAPDSKPADFGLAVKWGDTAWPPWAEYEPIVRVALPARLPMVAANLSQPLGRAVVHQGLSAFDESTVKRLGLERPLPPSESAALDKEIRDVHCDALPESLIAPMALAQRARDATLADRILERDSKDGTVLIAGGGHARKGRGVPLYLGQRKPGATALSVSFVEVRSGRDDPRAYAVKDSDTAPFDFLWFTPRVNDTDHCAELKAGSFHSPAPLPAETPKGR